MTSALNGSRMLRLCASVTGIRSGGMSNGGVISTARTVPAFIAMRTVRVWVEFEEVVA